MAPPTFPARLSALAQMFAESDAPLYIPAPPDARPLHTVTRQKGTPPLVTVEFIEDDLAPPREPSSPE